MVKKSGWEPIPISLKVISVLSILWMIGSVFTVQTRFELGIPFFGLFILGISAATIVILLDIVGPLIFLIGLWKRKVYGYYSALAYTSIFILNS